MSDQPKPTTETQLPCAFCGGRSAASGCIGGMDYIRCLDCGTTVGLIKEMGKPLLPVPDTIQGMWNRRPQPKPTGEVMVAGCEITGGSSRVCEHGQKSCEIRHAKPTGEWTGLILSRLIKEKGYKGAADSHNAALADEERRANDSIKENVRLMNQLAAEREKVKRRDLLVRTWQDNYADIVKQQIKDELAKVGK